MKPIDQRWKEKVRVIRVSVALLDFDILERPAMPGNTIDEMERELCRVIHAESVIPADRPTLAKYRSVKTISDIYELTCFGYSQKPRPRVWVEDCSEYEI